jgi:hypothetical protein
VRKQVRVLVVFEELDADGKPVPDKSSKHGAVHLVDSDMWSPGWIASKMEKAVGNVILEKLPAFIAGEQAAPRG